MKYQLRSDARHDIDGGIELEVYSLDGSYSGGYNQGQITRVFTPDFPGSCKFGTIFPYA